MEKLNRRVLLASAAGLAGSALLPLKAQQIPGVPDGELPPNWRCDKLNPAILNWHIQTMKPLFPVIENRQFPTQSALGASLGALVVASDHLDSIGAHAHIAAQLPKYAHLHNSNGGMVNFNTIERQFIQHGVNISPQVLVSLLSKPFPSAGDFNTMRSKLLVSLAQFATLQPAAGAIRPGNYHAGARIIRVQSQTPPPPPPQPSGAAATGQTMQDVGNFFMALGTVMAGIGILVTATTSETGVGAIVGSTMTLVGAEYGALGGLMYIGGVITSSYAASAPNQAPNHL